MLDISVIIPSIGRLENLTACLESVAAQSASGFEVIVVLDGVAAPVEPSTSVIRGRADWPFPIRWIDQNPRRGPGAARNRGASVAEGEALVFLDDDMTVTTSFIGGYRAALSLTPGKAVLGAIETQCPGYGGVYKHSAEAYWRERHQRLMGGEVPSFAECYSGNLAVPRSLFERAGGFDEALARNEDVDFGLRLEQAGGGLVYAGSAQALQHYRKSPVQAWRDSVATGAAAIQLWRRYPTARRQMCFAVASHGRRNVRRFRRWALDRPWPWHWLTAALPWLPDCRLTREFSWMLQDLAAATGARRELADEAAWTALSEGALFLCYHRFCGEGEQPSEFVTEIGMFERQLRLLQRAGYRFVTAHQWADAWKRAELLPGRIAVLTIDDGTRDIAELALPVLERLGIPVTVYLVRDWMREPVSLTGTDLSRIRQTGSEIGSHSLSHPWLTQVPAEQQRREVAESRAAVQAEAGLPDPPATFAYPYGDHNPAVRQLAAEAGYGAAVGTSPGYAYLHTDNWDVPRFVVDGRWPLWMFRVIVLHGMVGPGLP